MASVHTRFDTYLAYYHLQALEPLARDIMRRFYHRCEVVLAPAESTAAILRAQRMNRDIAIWARGVDREQFNPERRDMEWRRSIGIGDDEMVIAFLGRIVMEKGLDVFSDAIHAFAKRGFKHRVIVIGEGPARPWFEEQLPQAIFTGQLTGTDLARALASADLFLNPSITEAFGNVTLEAMACGLPVVAAEFDRRDQPRPRQGHRDSGRRHRCRRVRRRARGLCPRSRLAPAPWRGGPRHRQDDGLGHDQLGRDPRLQACDRQAPAPDADDGTLGSAYLSRSIRCAASSRIAAISWSSLLVVTRRGRRGGGARS